MKRRTWPHRLAARTTDFQSVNRSSILRGVTTVFGSGVLTEFHLVGCHLNQELSVPLTVWLLTTEVHLAWSSNW
jgi:hypothetical protein